MRVGAFELDVRAGALLRDQQRVVLQEQPLQILRMLVEAGGKVVTREDIKKRLLPNDTIVEFDHSIHTAINKLRKAFNDPASSPSYIETVARRGYRLMVRVEFVSADDSSADESSAESSVAGSASDSAVSVDSNTDNLPKAKLRVGRLTGKVVSHYRVLEVIGGGGMGLVYRAEDLKLGRAVALKFLPEEVGDDPKARERLEREAHAVSALDHPNICTVYDFDEHEGHPFIAMQLLQGKTLRDHIAEGRFRLTQPEGLEIAIQIASGLEAAHEKGIIHRDIKPANIFITEKNVAKILDFGVAKVRAVVEASENPHPGNRSRDGVPEDDDLKGHGFSRAATASLQDGRGDQSHAGFIPPQSSEEAPFGTAEAVPLQSSNCDGAPEGAPLQPPGLKPGQTDDAECRAEARLYPNRTTLTRTGMKLGTAGYMSPEQVRGEALDARTDIFSFGLVLYEMATGERAFTGETEAILHNAIQHRDPKRIREFDSSLPAELDSIINKALAKHQEMRYATVSQMDADLEQLARRTPRRSVRRSRKWVVSAALLAAIAVGGYLYWRSHRSIKLAQVDTMVLADFANSTGDAVFDGTLKQALTMELGQSPFLTVASNEKIAATLKLMGRSGSERLSEVTAREVCLRTNGRALLTGSISKRGELYRLETRVLDCHTGDVLVSVSSDAASRDRVIVVIGELGNQLRNKLGESLASIEKYDQPLEQATTASIEALQAYTQGNAQQSQKGDAAAVPYFKLAVELDPTFAVAHAALGQAHYTLYEVSQALEDFERAFALRERVSQRERFYIEGVYYFLTGDLDKSIQTYEQWAKAYPRDYQPHNDLSRRLRSTGQYERAADEARQALAITRDSSAAFTSLMLASIRLNRLNDAKAAFDEAQARKLDGTYLHLARYQVAFLEGDNRGMAEQLAIENGKPGIEDILLHAQGDTEAYYGRFHKSREFSDRAVESAKRAGAPERAAIHETWLAIQEAEAGMFELARQTAAEALALSKGEYVTAKAALALARAGSPTQAQKLANQLNQKLPSETVEQNYSLAVIRAAIAMSKKNPGKSIDILKVTLPYELGASSICCMFPTYVRGLAYLQIGQPREAVGEFQKMLEHPGTVINLIPGALAYLQLGRAQVMIGDNDAARKSYQDFLTLWKDADPDIPIYRQAEAEYAKLR